jgi:serine/threonine protein kinase/tetratricopeptide (TPR) repeat protein
MEELGRGGMGVVYQAYDEKHGRDVALKTLQRMSPDDIVRFKQEFRALSDIAHPNLASLYELLSDGKTWCFTMEILEGVEFLNYIWSEFDSMRIESERPSLAQVAGDSQRLSMRRMNRLFESIKQLAVGLNELHRVDKLHSDIKPSNVLVTTEGRVVLLDFGLIAEISKDEDGRVPRVIQGTPHYMSPEQAACAPLSGASDWYAVGVMLYELLTGRLPIRDTAMRIMLRKQYDIPVEPIKRQPDIPPELSELCMALLEINPRNRPSTTDVLRAVDAEDIARNIEESQPVTVVRSVDLVGREEHFETLNQVFSDVVAGETRSVFVHGKSGMGKSVLIRTFVDDIHSQNEAIILEGRCYEQESVPFKALDDLIDSLVIYLGTQTADDLRQLIPDDMLPLTRLFPVLGQIPGAASESRQSLESADPLELRQRAMNALRELLIRLGERRPIVLYIDDMQWGDEDSANLLADLLRPPASPRVLLLGSYRREDIDTSPSLLALADAYNKGQAHPHSCELLVEPLSSEDATRLAMMLLNRTDSVTKRFAERIAQESAGSPFFVWELAQHIQEDSDTAVGSLELDEVIWSRVRRLPADTRRLLEVFAVAGRPMHANEAYQAIDEVTHGPGLLAQLKTNNFIRTTEYEEDTVVETYHDRIRESVVNHLASARVRGHHLKLALVIEQASTISASDVETHIRDTPEFAEPGEPFDLDKRQWQRVFDLAYSFDAADKPDRALFYAVISAERAWQQNAYDVAERQFDIARRGADSASDAIRFRIAEGLGDVLMIRGRYDQANQHFQAARSLATDNLALARIDGKRGNLCFKQGDMANSVKHLERALSELGNSPPKRLMQTAVLLKESCIQILHTYLPRLFTNRRSAGTERAAVDSFRARLYEGLGYPYWFSRGPVPTLWTHLRHMNLAERYPPSPELGRAYAMHAVMITAIPLAERGVAYAERAYEIHSDLGDRLGQGKARSFQTFSLLALGRFREAVESGREAVRRLEQAGDVWEANMARIILSQPLYFLGDFPNAHREAKHAYEIGKETGDHSAMAIALYFWLPASPHALPEGALQAERERPREDPLSASAAIQGRGLELLLREDNPVEAAKVIGESLDVARQRGLRNPCIFEGVAWRATALRCVAEREDAGAARQTALAEAKKAVRDALKITKKYLTCRPRALRECAEIAVIEGREARALRFLKESLRVAEQQEAVYEHAHSLLARGKAGLKFGWPDADEQIAEGNATIARIETFERDGDS